MRDFNHTVNILVKAYLNGTLQHGNCFACAVGNMVADSMNHKLTHNTKDDAVLHVVWNGYDPIQADVMYPGVNGWGQVFCTSALHQMITESEYKGLAKSQIDSTGYTWQELAKVERAFESTCYKSYGDDKMFDGLMAVVDVLAEIHEVDLTQREEAKLLFVKA